MTKSKQRYVVVCTAKRGVFAGTTLETNAVIMKRGTLTLTNARMCTYWSEKTKGVLGLASIGPQDGSKIGPEVPELACESVTAIITCTDVAKAAWAAAPWK
jgi:hypothetical protein